MKNTAQSQPTMPQRGNFYVIGLNYRKADADIREHFSISESAQKSILSQAKEEGSPALCVVSTCNRTELYGFAQHPFQLIKLLCEHTHGTVEEFEKVAYIHKNNEAVSHIFKVGTGLDSQILGDFEIISQLRKGFRLSKEMGMMDPYLERLANAVIQASKRIKNETGLSSGTTSVSFAAVQYILENVTDISNKRILLFGTGKIGRNTCENLVKHTENKQLTLINRTRVTAEAVAGKFNLVVRDFEDLSSEIDTSDILIVSTGADIQTVTTDLVNPTRPLLILDLSMPRNVSPEVAHNEHVTLVHLDALSRVTDSTLERRKMEIPAAEDIISEIKKEFITWAENRKFAPTIQALKAKLADMKIAEIDFQKKKIPGFDEQQAEIISDRIIHKITTHFANHLKADNASSESIELIKRVFQLENQ